MDIIIVIYINVGNKSIEEATLYMDKMKKAILLHNDKAMMIFVPTRKDDSRIECINPIILDKKEYQTKVSKIMFDAQVKLDEFIDSELKKLDKKKSNVVKSKIVKPKK